MGKSFKQMEQPRGNETSSSSDDSQNSSMDKLNRNDQPAVVDQTWAPPGPSGSNVTFYSNQAPNPNYGASKNVTFNESANKTFAPTSMVDQTFAPGSSSHYDQGLGQNMYPSNPNATFLGQTLANMTHELQYFDQTDGANAIGNGWGYEPPPPPPRHSAHGNDPKMPSNDSINHFETPKSSKKRRRMNEDYNEANAEFDPFVNTILNPKTPLQASVGCITTIDAFLNSNTSPKSLFREDFIRALAKVLADMLNDVQKHKTDVEVVMKILERIGGISPEAKTMVQTCCYQPLNQLSSQTFLVNKATELLGQLRR